MKKKSKLKSQPELRFQLLGCFQVWRSEERIPPKAWKSEKSKTLLKLLLIKRGTVVSRDQLSDLLFPNHDLGKAFTNLRVHISELRRVLEPKLRRGLQSQFILTSHEGYCFNSEANYTVDIEMFERHFNKAIFLEQHGRYAQAIRNYEAAVRLYQGDLLLENRYDDWAISERERAQDEFLVVLARLAECYAQQGNYRQAIVCCRKAMCLEGYHEDFCRQLMRFHCLADNPTEAVRIYRQFKKRLYQGTLQKPSMKTQRLYEQIQHHRVINAEQYLFTPSLKAPVTSQLSVN